MSVEENKALVRRYWESGYQEAMRGNLDVVHQYFADHFHDHTTLHPEHPGVQGLKEILSDSSQATPDLRHEAVDIAAEDDLVFVHWRAIATHEGQHQMTSMSVTSNRRVMRRPCRASACIGSRAARSSKAGDITTSWSTHSLAARLGHQEAPAPNLRGPPQRPLARLPVRSRPRSTNAVKTRFLSS